MKELDELRKNKFRVVGTGEVIRALKTGKVSHVFIAKDAAQSVIEPVLRLCKENSAEVWQTLSMKELGVVCGIHVGAASAALLKEGKKNLRGKGIRRLST